MADIKFKVDEMMSFCCLWRESLMNFNSPQLNDYLNNFNNPEIKKISQTYPRGIKAKTSELIKQIQDGKIKDIDGMISFLDSSFAGYAKEKGDVLKEVFNGYSEFFNSVKNVMSGNLEVMQRLQSDDDLGYQRELDGVYKVFGVDAEKDQTHAYLNPSPAQPLYDGMCPGTMFYQNFSVSRLSDAEYIGDSTVNKNKISTPLHEATHHIFAQSQLKKDIQAGNIKGRTKEVMSVLGAYIEATSDKQPRGATALSALDEAFAACSSAVIYQKSNGGKLPDEWYHGFEAADRLAPKVFPLYQEYMEQGKSFDEAFFTSLSKKLGSLRAINGKARCCENISDIPKPQAKLSADKKAERMFVGRDGGR